MDAARLALPGFIFGSLLAGGLRQPRDWALASCLFWLWAVRQPAPRPSPWLPWLGVLLLSAAVSTQPYLSLAPLSRHFAAAAVWALAARGLDRRHWPRALAVVGALVCLAAVAGSWSLRGHYNPRDLGEVTTGLFPQYYNYTAFVGGAAAAAGITLWPLGALPLAAFAAFAWTTKPRAALLALLAAVSALALRRGWWKPVALAGLLGLGVLALKRDRAAVAKRPQIWKAALQVLADKPLLGEGPGNFEAGFRRHNFPSDYRRTRYQFTTAYAHSQPLHAAAETGLAGLAALAAVAAMSAHLLFDNMLHVPGFLLLYASGLAVLSGEPEAWGKGAWRLFCAAGAALSLAAWLVPAHLPAEPSTLEARARAEISQGKPAEAAATLAAAEKLNPTNALYPVMRAELMRVAGDWPAAESLAARGLELEPNFAQARLILAEAAARRGDTAAARAHLGKVSRIDASNTAEFTGYDRMVLHFDEGRHALIRKLIQSAP
jgi:O-antigen ligase